MQKRHGFLLSLQKFEYNHDFEKIDDALLEHVILYEIDCYIFLLFGVNIFTI